MKARDKIDDNKIFADVAERSLYHVVYMSKIRYTFDQ